MGLEALTGSQKHSKDPFTILMSDFESKKFDGN